jgi:hypothetical protein
LLRSLTEVYRRFTGSCCLIIRDKTIWKTQQAPLKRRQTSTRLHGATIQNTAIFELNTVITWNLSCLFKLVKKFLNQSLGRPRLYFFRTTVIYLRIYTALLTRTTSSTILVISFTQKNICNTDIKECKQLLQGSKITEYTVCRNVTHLSLWWYRNLYTWDVISTCTASMTRTDLKNHRPATPTIAVQKCNERDLNPFFILAPSYNIKK